MNVFPKIQNNPFFALNKILYLNITCTVIFFPPCFFIVHVLTRILQQKLHQNMNSCREKKKKLKFSLSNLLMKIPHDGVVRSTPLSDGNSKLC